MGSFSGRFGAVLAVHSSARIVRELVTLVGTATHLSLIKSEKKLLKVSRRLTNIRHNYIHQITSEIVNRKPMFIVLEDLNEKV